MYNTIGMECFKVCLDGPTINWIQKPICIILTWLWGFYSFAYAIETVDMELYAFSMKTPLNIAHSKEAVNL